MEHVETLEQRRRERPEAEPRRRLARNAAVALASVGVLALLVAYALAAPTPELELTVGEVVPQPGTTAVVQGRTLQPDASALRGVRVEVRRGATTAVDVSDASGRFRVDLAAGCGVYELTLAVEWKGSELERRAWRRLCPGDSLPLEANVITQGHFLWVPGPR